jgi:hypothetical protein
MPDDAVESRSAKDLLDLYLQLRGFVPNMREWAEDRFADSPPILYRLQRFYALLRAFELGTDPSEFAHGHFIKPLTIHRYEALIARMSSELEQMIGHRQECHPCRLPRCFEILLDYREQLERLLAFSSGVLAASGFFTLCVQESGRSQRHRRAVDINHR